MSSQKSRAGGPKTVPLFMLAAMAAGGVLLTGCSEFSFTGPEPLEAEEVRWASALGIQLADFEEQPSGLWIRVDEEGEDGTPAGGGDNLLVDYDGWLPDGRMFDSSREPAFGARGPLSFRLGVDPLIAGFEEGVTGMQVNEVRMLLIPPGLGYGLRSSGSIPPNSWLAFRVELIDRQPPPGS
jgi:FKBP-type peptidyl-prolyl cis-trans isomerase FkpA